MPAKKAIKMAKGFNSLTSTIFDLFMVHPILLVVNLGC